VALERGTKGSGLEWRGLRVSWPTIRDTTFCFEVEKLCP
jgi:hypothetical protein